MSESRKPRRRGVQFGPPPANPEPVVEHVKVEIAAKKSEKAGEPKQAMQQQPPQPPALPEAA